MSLDSLKGKHIVLGISGGIAAYKSAYLLRLFVKAGAEVQVVITPSGKEFITPATLAALSGKPVVSEFFAANTGEWHSHVDLGIWADLMVVAPATACTIAKMANGVADNMLITTYLSAKEQVMVAPAMDLDMWRHPATQRNMRTLQSDGVLIVEPASGELASGLTGKGRMAEPEVIAQAAADYFSRCGCRDLEGKKVVITAGPTHERLDPVRFIGNYSTGKMGFAIARECARRGADVVVVAGPVATGLELPECVRRVDVVSAREMLAAVESEYDSADVFVMSAAVADFAPESVSESKIKRGDLDSLSLKLVKNPDIAKTVGTRNAGHGDGKLVVGFALETDDEVANALKKIESKHLDYVVMNSLRDKGAGFGCDTNRVSVISASGERRDFPLKSKDEVAADIMDIISERLSAPQSDPTAL